MANPSTVNDELLEDFARKMANDIIKEGFSSIKGNLMILAVTCRNDSTAAPLLTRKDIKLLRWAVREAASWRGTMTGHDEAAAALAIFDAKINVCRETLKRLDSYTKKVEK